MSDKPARITQRSNVGDGIVEAIRSIWDPLRNKYTSEIKDSREAERISAMTVKANFYGDQYSLQFLDNRSSNMLNVGRKNAELMRNMVQGVIDTEKKPPDKNKGVKAQVDELFLGLFDE